MVWLRERDKKNNLYDTIFQHWKWNPADTRQNKWLMDSNKPEQNEKTRTVRNTHSNDNLEKKKKESWTLERD